MKEMLRESDRQQLLAIARQALEDAVHGRELRRLDLANLPDSLQQPGATFVTLTRNGMLRGCIGALEAQLPLAWDVQEHAVAAALEDPRFPPLQPSELPGIQLEISRLTAPQPLHYQEPTQLPGLLKPGVDGVILKAGQRRATFLPQVWEKLPLPEEFLDHLCLKLGTQEDYWRTHKLEVFTYRVEEFHEHIRN